MPHETTLTAAQKGAAIPPGHFEFGKNWTRFLNVVNEDRIRDAETSLRDMLQVSDLKGKRFLDIGCGSGLSSLAAHRLGADVHSMDYDRQAVACTQEMKRRFAAPDSRWKIEQGSALDAAYLHSLGTFDVVYSWGVLHHTGNMRLALDNALIPVGEQGYLWVAIYNDQGLASRVWLKIKKGYNHSPRFLQWVWVVLVGFYFLVRSSMSGLIKRKNLIPRRDGSEDNKLRGMSAWYDLIDWVGGYPFEVAKPEAIFDFYRQKGFQLLRLKTCAGGFGCNEFLFQKQTP